VPLYHKLKATVAGAAPLPSYTSIAMLFAVIVATLLGVCSSVCRNFDDEQAASLKKVLLSSESILYL